MLSDAIIRATMLLQSTRPDLPDLDLSYLVIGAAIEVHKALGPGFLEKVYETALAIEFAEQNIPFVQQAPLAVKYKGRTAGQFFADFLVDSRVICEIKAVEALNEIHEAQVLNYLRTTTFEVGLLINFGEKSIRVRRLAGKPK